MKKKHFNSYLMRIYCACAILLPIVIIFSTTIASRINEERYKRLVYGNSMEALRLFSDTINKMMLETADDMVQYIFDKDVGFYLNNAFAPNDYTVRMHVQEKLRDLRQYNELVESVYLFSGLRSEVLTLEGVYALKHGDKNDENTKRGIINIFLRAVYLFDEALTLILNDSDKPIVIDDILLDEIEEGLDNDLVNHNLCSPLVADAPPQFKKQEAVQSR